MKIQRFRTSDKAVDLKAVEGRNRFYQEKPYYVVSYLTSKGAIVEITFYLLAKAKEMIASILGLCVDQLNDYKVGWRG